MSEPCVCLYVSRKQRSSEIERLLVEVALIINLQLINNILPRLYYVSVPSVLSDNIRLDLTPSGCNKIRQDSGISFPSDVIFSVS